MMSAMAYKLTPALRTEATANVRAFHRCVAGLNRRSRYSGTLRTLEP